MIGKEEQQPSDALATIIKTVRFMCFLVGADVMAPNYRVNWVTKSVIFCITMYFIFTITSIIDAFADDWTFMLEASCMLGSVIQGCTKLASAIFLKKSYCGVRLLLERLYTEFQEKGDNYTKALRKCIVRIRTTVKVVGAIYFVGTVFVCLMPFTFMWLRGERLFIMHFFIPGVDPSTFYGYIITSVAHYSCLLFGVFGLYAGDLLFLIFMMQPMLFVDILKLKVAELNEKCQKDNQNIRNLLIDVVEWHKFYTDFNETGNQMFYYNVATQITTSGISILCTLYILVYRDWPGVYVYLILLFSVLYIYCILGTQIEICNDEFCKEIYNINWYEMRPAERKIICMMLMKSQTPSSIKVGGVIPLSVNTALTITRMLYGVFTMMVQTME